MCLTCRATKSAEDMAPRLHLSLKHAYELYVEQEIENYKFSLPRQAILRIGDEAVTSPRGSRRGG